MSTINNLSNLFISQGVTNQTQQKPDAAEKFNAFDASEKSILDTVELSEMAKEIASLVEQGDGADTFMDQYSEGLLQGEEKTMVQEMGRLPQDIGSHVWQALQSYIDNVGEKTVATLQLLNKENPSSLSVSRETTNGSAWLEDNSTGTDELADDVDMFLNKRGFYRHSS